MPSTFQRLASLGLLTILIVGCGREQPPPAPVTTTVKQPTSDEPGQIELFDPKVTMTEPDRIRFEVSYRFVKGRPEKHYMCDISFPGTPNHASKPLFGWELQESGVIKDGLTLQKPPAATFEIRMSEADSPQNGYKPISNVAKGAVK